MSSNPKPGEGVFVKFHRGDHIFHTAVAIVLAVNPSPDPDEPATLSLVYMQPNASHRNLIGPTWEREFIRSTGIKHESNPDVQSGKESIAWGGLVLRREDIADAAPDVQLRAGSADPADRLKPQPEPEATTVSRQQATRVQTAKEPPVSVVSPAVNEPEPVFETKHYADGSSATGVAPLPDLSPDEQAAKEAALKAENEKIAAQYGIDLANVPPVPEGISDPLSGPWPTKPTPITNDGSASTEPSPSTPGIITWPEPSDGEPLDPSYSASGTPEADVSSTPAPLGTAASESEESTEQAGQGSNAPQDSEASTTEATA